MPKKHPRGNQYIKRKRNLKTLGFASYCDYLKSDLWKSIRLRVLQRDSFTCKRCKGRATQVHHRRYTLPVLRGENIGLLTPLCADCHHFCEFDGERKTGISGANHRIKVRATA